MAAETIRIEIPIETIDNTDPTLTNVTKKLDAMGSAATRAGASATKAGTQVSKFDRNSEKTQKTLSKWAKEKYQILLEAKDKISPILSSIGSGIRNVAGKTWNITMKAIDLVTSPVRGIINLLKNPIFQVGAVLGISFGLKDTIETYKNFEAAMSQVSAISGATGSNLDKLTAKAKEMGSTTKFTSTEAAEAFNYMAMAGWKTEDMLSGIEGILNLAAASGEDLATTSDIVTDALTAFGLKASDATHFSDVLARAASSANTNVSMMGETFKYAGAMAGTLGYSIEDVGVMVGLMANSGIKASSAGTQLNSIFTRLSTNTGKSRDAIEALGISFFDSTGKARDLSDVIDELRAATANYTDEQKTGLANTIAGTRAQSGLLAILNASEEDYKKLTEAIGNADGASQQMADTMLDNLSGSITLLQSALDGVKISFGERLSPYVRGMADWLTDQMPNVESALDQLMDFVDRKIESGKKKLSEITKTDEWANADFFGKGKILWDEFIGQPFLAWWNSTGKTIVSDIAQDMGGAIGSGLKFGILTLLGIDVSSALDDGSSVGASFAKGFAEGFDGDLIVAKLGEALKNMFSSAGKLLPGGEAPDMSSLLSAAILMKMGSPLMGLGKGAFKIGKGLFGTNPVTGTSLMGSIIGSTGNSMVQGTGLLNILANAGYSLSGGAASAGGYFGAGTALSGGGAALLGGAGILGGLVGGASFISGAADWYKGSKSNDKAEKEALQSSGRMKMGGVAAGAVAGAAIGSFIPVIGTAAGALIGAGVGGVAGWIAGNKKKKEYEEQVKLAAEAAEAERKAQELISSKAAFTGRALENVRFESEALTDALNDSNVSATDFAKQLQEAVSDKIQGAFGDIVLSAQEIKSIASSIVFDGQTEQIDKMNSAISAANDALSDFKSDFDSLEKLNWQNGLGITLGEDDLENYKSQIDAFVEDAKKYLNDKHYEATLTTKMLLGDDADLTNLDATYGNMQEQMESLSTRLTEVTQKALEDGVISTETVFLPDGSVQLSEQAEITRLQNQISEIVNRVSQAESDAKLDAMKIKYGGSDLSAGSFQQLQQELAANLEEMTANYDEALEIDLKNLHLQFPEGGAEFDEAFAQLQDAYNQKVGDLNFNVQSFQLQTIADAFGEELDGILPELQGTTAEKMRQVMNVALAVKPDPMTWTQDDISEWFGLDSLTTETQMALSEFLQSTASTVPESMKSNNLEEAIKSVTEGYGPLSDSGYEEIASQFREIGTRCGTSMTDAVTQQIADSPSSIRTATETAISSAFANPFNVTANVNVTPNISLNQQATSAAIQQRLSLSPISTSKHAAGGYVNTPQMSWLAEEGYGEYVIPTNPRRRTRAIELYQQAGQALGIGHYAEGGYAAGSNDAQNGSYSASYGLDYNLFNDAARNVPYGYIPARGDNSGEGIYVPGVSAGNPKSVEPVSGSPEIKVSVQASPTFEITGSGNMSEDDIVSVVRRHMREMADELGGEIADRLEVVFSNMPLKEA